MTAGVGVFHVPVSISVDSFRGTATVLAIFDGDDLNDRLPEFAGGTVDPDGAFRLLYINYGDYTIRGDFSGTLGATSGTLSGTRVLTRETTGDGETHTCKGTVLRVELPKQ
jgi:hypothetical protein